MNKYSILIFLFVLPVLSILPKSKKQLTEINSTITKERIEFKYNSKNELVYFNEKGIASFREFKLKYGKDNQLIECSINEDNGESRSIIKYSYVDGYIMEDIQKTGNRFREKEIEINKIELDKKNRLAKTTFDNGKAWEEFEYDNYGNIITYKINSVFGDEEQLTEYTYDDNKSIFSDTNDPPSWFWAWNMNHMKWCTDFVGNNNIKSFTVEDQRFGTEHIDVSYEYDNEGYPIKQFYDGKLAKEFIYKEVK